MESRIWLTVFSILCTGGDCSVKLREEYRLRVFEKRVHRIKFEFRREGVTRN